jgi:hypothetical protein
MHKKVDNLGGKYGKNLKCLDLKVLKDWGNESALTLSLLMSYIWSS